MPSKPATLRLQIFIMSKDMATPDIGTTVKNLQEAERFAKAARKQVEAQIALVRQARDADPNWTDEEICEEICGSLSEKICKCDAPNDKHPYPCPARVLAK